MALLLNFLVLCVLFLALTKVIISPVFCIRFTFLLAGGLMVFWLELTSFMYAILGSISNIFILDSGWRWTDGSPVNFLDWAPGEPDEVDETQLCVMMHNRYWPGLWFNIECEGAWRSYICQAEKGNTMIGMFV